MADLKISQFPSLTTPLSSDILPIVHSGADYNIAVNRLSSPRASTIVIAAYNSSDTTHADYVCTGTNDQTTIQAALNSASNSAARIYLMEGTYNISATITCGGGNPGGYIIEGAGWNTQLNLTNGSNCYMFDFGFNGSPVYTPGFVFRNIYFNCNGTNQTTAGGGIFARGAVWCLFDHLWIEQPWEAGIRFYQDGVGNYGHHNTISNCEFKDGKLSNGGHGWAIKFEQCDENHVFGNTFQDNGAVLGDGHNAQIYDTSAGLQEIVANAFVNGGSGVPGIFSDSNPGTMQITSNVFDNIVASHCIKLAGSLNNVVGNAFTGIGHNASSPFSGVYLNGATQTTIVGNTFSSSGANAQGVFEDNSANFNTIGLNTFNGTWNTVPIIYVGANDLIMDDGLGNANVYGNIVSTGYFQSANSLNPNNGISVSSQAVTVPVTSRLTTVTNNAALAPTITITTTGAIDGQLLIVRFYDFSAVSQTLAWVNTENSGASVPTTSNGSTTLPKTVQFQYNGQTSKWRCITSS